jgi:hypothetical protein
MSETTDEKPPLKAVKDDTVLVTMFQNWRIHAKALSLKRGSPEYFYSQHEFWLGACLTAELLGHKFNPVVVIFLLAGRDMLDLEEKLDVQPT